MSVAKHKSGEQSGGMGETIRIVIHALLIALVIRTFLFQPFSIPSGSMKSTLLIGDYLFVSKFSYGYSRYSMPFGPPLFSGRILAGMPERGDVAVFKLPRDNATDYIKRVIGLPGDKLQVIGGTVHINGVPVKRERLEDYVERDGRGGEVVVPRYRETLPNGKSYMVLDLVDNGYGDNTPEYVVPEGHYFVMGDNRDNSTDSRFLNMVGYIPFENFVGRAEVLFLSLEEGSRFWEFWKWPTSIRWSRLFSGVE